jgi:hypothetical protein
MEAHPAVAGEFTRGVVPIPEPRLVPPLVIRAVGMPILVGGTDSELSDIETCLPLQGILFATEPTFPPTQPLCGGRTPCRRALRRKRPHERPTLRSSSRPPFSEQKSRLSVRVAPEQPISRNLAGRRSGEQNDWPVRAEISRTCYPLTPKPNGSSCVVSLWHAA